MSNQSEDQPLSEYVCRVARLVGYQPNTMPVGMLAQIKHYEARGWSDRGAAAAVRQWMGISSERL